jgi:hypothetical protein
VVCQDIWQYVRIIYQRKGKVLMSSSVLAQAQLLQVVQYQVLAVVLASLLEVVSKVVSLLAVDFKVVHLAPLLATSAVDPTILQEIARLKL